MKVGRRVKRKVELSACVTAASEWFRQGHGRILLERERHDIEEALNCLFGYHLCQISICRDMDLTQTSRIAHAFSLNPNACGPDSKDAACCDFHRLPLAPESVDVFLLHHTLDYSSTPHQLLVEAVKATIPRGHIIIVGFNPWSIGGAWRALKRVFSGKVLWRQQHLRLGRLYDWFALLELDVVDVKRGHFWPFTQESPATATSGKLERMMRRYQAPWGDYYIVTVRKDVLGAIPLKPQWHEAKLVPLAGVSRELSGRQASCSESKKQ
ncbi:methyltransferase domain-containing protein [Gilvimarinus sp. SDUM040013]|uniref:Methyltransferase domain-containing protein n=1 Tax=Gilvimarinus gilvus TaxID=3058038 RepID=A0ABU4RWT8_9GAMM|nr:methyltransferase domain-containing protein [Gilvimarinus sp. SDUM040013]MDO3385690.1 methyltransferase domain-containing protein [Gilvimarinus sp. SDUM040013]MDX6849328.1 methyltransferase domain-containing protein [Gilvimarinus sp. SDUM040013]